MRALFLLASLLLLCVGVPAYGQVLYADDFEAGVSGWSQNSAEIAPGHTRYMGRFSAGLQQTSRTFAVPSNTQFLRIGFDLYRFDSWDDNATYGFDRFQVTLNSALVLSVPLPAGTGSLSGTSGNVSWTMAAGPEANTAWGSWTDITYRVTIIVENPPASVNLLLRTNVNQSDESAGYDNFIVRAIPATPALSLAKTSSIVPGGTGFAVPGEDVLYRLSLTSTGAAVDDGSLVFIDTLPPNLSLFTGANSPSSTPVAFTELSAPSSGLSCCTSANIAYSNTTTGPLVFGYVPNGSYDPAVTAVRITPSGRMREGVTSPVNVRFEFKAQIK